MRYFGLQHYEPGMQYDAHECLLQLLAKIYPNINDECMFKINKLESILCNDCGHTTKMMVYVLMVFAFRGVKQSSNNKRNVTSVYGSKGRILRKFQMC